MQGVLIVVMQGSGHARVAATVRVSLRGSEERSSGEREREREREIGLFIFFR